jgi:hypothetical protein
MEQWVRVQNERDRLVLAWLRSQLGDAAIISASTQCATFGGKPYLSAICRLLRLTQFANEDHYTYFGEERRAHAWVDARTGQQGLCWITDDEGVWSNFTGEPPTDEHGRLAEEIAVMGWFGRSASERKLDAQQHDETPEAVEDKAPLFSRQSHIACEDCGMQTPWEPIGNDKHAALDLAGVIWNTRFNRPVATEGDLLDLIRKEISAVDIPYILDLLSRTTEDWETRGPIFAMLAQKVVDSKITMRDYWPVDPVLCDAARFRTLVQLAKFVYIDRVASVQFPRIPATGGDDDSSFEARIGAAVDDLPERSRW